MFINEIKEMIAIADECGHVPLVTGPHGIGKSESPRQYAAEQKMYFECLILSLMDTGDLLGMPKTSNVGGMESTIWAAPSWYMNIVNAAWPEILPLDRLEFNDEEFETHIKSATAENAAITRGDLNKAYCDFYKVPNDRIQLLRQNNVTYMDAVRSILLLDEFNRALPDVLNGTLQLILDHRLHSHELPIVDGKETLIIAAVNPSDGSYTVTEFDPALQDRFVDCPAEVDFKAWRDWATPKGVNKIIIDFLTDNPKKIHFEPADGSKGASPRSWTRLGTYMDWLAANKKEINASYVVGTVGSSLAAQFLMFFNTYEDGVTVEKLETAINKLRKKKDMSNNPEEIATHLVEKVMKLESIRRMDFAEVFINKYGKKSTAEEAMNMLVFLYTLPVENLSSVLKNLQNDDIEKYANLAKLDKEANNKGLFMKIVSKIDNN